MGDCSSRVPGTYVPLMRALADMTATMHAPAIPTIQWFCARGLCPMVIAHTLPERDRSHFTLQYSEALAPVLGLELKPILARFEGSKASLTMPSSRLQILSLLSVFLRGW